jgi:phosphate-selective porin OprO/OprP
VINQPKTDPASGGDGKTNKVMKRLLKWIVPAVLGATILANSAMADDTADAIAALKKQIEALSAKVESLEQQHQAELQHQAPAVTTPPTGAVVGVQTNVIPEMGFVTAGSNGFWLRSADSNFTLHLQGVGQLDGHYYQSFSPSQKDTLTIRRLRAIASGTLYHDYDYYVQTDFGAGNSVTATNNSLLQDAYLNIHYWPGFQIQGGKFKEPVGLEILPADASLWFLERGYPTELVPNRNVGIEVHGDLFNGALSYAAGMFNGVNDGGSGDIETGANSKDVAARIFAQPFRNTTISGLNGFGIGFGTSYGYEGGTTLPSFASLGRQTFFSYTNGAGASVAESGDHLRLVPQGWYFWGPAGFYWEYADSSEIFQLNRTGQKYLHERFDTKAWDVSASWYLTGEKNSLFSPPAPIHPFHTDGSGLGAWQLVGRVGGLSLDNGAFNKKADFATAGSAQNVTTWGVGLDWYMNKNIKWILEYEQSSFGFAPGYQAKAGTVSAQDEKVLLTRLQFTF